MIENNAYAKFFRESTEHYGIFLIKAYYGKIIKFSQQKLCWGKTQDLILVAVFMHTSYNNIINFNIIALVRT